jgi:hypothetical protein
MLEPHISYDVNAFQAAITGELSKGGILSNNPQSFTITFACIPFKYTKSDVEITMKFQNNDVVSLYFQKECETIGEIKEFDILYTIYWILLLLILFFAIVSSYYYIEKNKDIIIEVLRDYWARFRVWIKQFTRKSRLEEENLTATKLDEFYEENDLVDVKIKTDSTHKINSNKNNNFNSFSTDYGGI